MDEAAPKRVDLDEVAHLVEQLERDLARARGRQLAGEVDRRQALSTPEPSHGNVHEGLHGVRERLGALSDELVGDAMKGSDYIARIARILGLG
jgi:hypothetical protein